MQKQKTIIIIVAALFIISIIVLFISLKNVFAPKPTQNILFEQYDEDLSADVDKEIGEIIKDEGYLNEIDSSLQENSSDQLADSQSAQSPQSAVPKDGLIFDMQSINNEMQSLQSDNELNSFFGDDALLKEINL